MITFELIFIFIPVSLMYQNWFNIILAIFHRLQYLNRRYAILVCVNIHRYCTHTLIGCHKGTLNHNHQLYIDCLILYCSKSTTVWSASNWQELWDFPFTQGNYATWDSNGMCHLMPRLHLPKWREKDELAFVHRGGWILNKDLAIDNTMPATVNCICKKSL